MTKNIPEERKLLKYSVHFSGFKLEKIEKERKINKSAGCNEVVPVTLQAFSMSFLGY